MNIENLALGYVKTAPSPATTGTSLTLETNEGARFPTTTTASFYVTLMPADEHPNSDNSEVVEVTDRTGDVLTIVREQRGTTAQNVGVGWIVLNSVYKEDLENLPGSNSIYVETPTGDIDGENDEFTLSNIPTTIIGIFHNRTFLTETEDYTISEDVITLVDIPIVGDSLTAVYLTADTVSGNADTLDGQHAPTGDIVGTTDTQTLTNKTLTSPKLNENVALTSTSTELNALDGQTGAWTSYTPTVSATTGTITTSSASGFYVTIGKTVFVKIRITITTNGTGGSQLRASLPAQAKSGNETAVLSGRENAVTGKMLQGLISSASNIVSLFTYDNDYPGGDGAICYVSGVYERS